MDGIIRAALAVSWRKFVLSVSLILVAIVTVWTYFAWQSWRLDAFVFAVNIGSEMNFAVWWISALLLLCTLSFYEFFCRGVAGHRAPWLLLAVIFLVLSWDELGSLHERTFDSGFGVALVGLLLVGALFAAAALYAVCRLIARTETRTSGWLLFFAFALYGSIGIQEFLEHKVEWPYWSKGLRTGVEEGTELVADFLVLCAIAAQRPELRGGLAQILPDTRALIAIRPVLLALLIVHAAVSLLYIPLLDPLTRHGNPAAWYPAAIYLLLACHVARRIIDPEQDRGEQERTSLWGGLALFLLVCSALISVRFDRWWPGMTIIEWLPVNFHVAYAYQLAVLGVLLAGLDQFNRRTLAMYAVAAALPLLVQSPGDQGLTFFVLGLSAYLYAEILYLAQPAARSVAAPGGSPFPARHREAPFL
ncbi:hypothetical protein [Rhodospirillaceae bacterium SYSU D60014]|uniref:hypothetical protein n=1 Tax=Virgifigura deserti TaxID=2268457 RepID=UPI000E668DB5